MISLVVLVMTLLGFSQALISSMVTSRVNREVAVATDAARHIISDLQGEAFDQVFANFNSGAAGNLLGNTVVTNSGFAIPGLRAMAGDADGFVGTIRMPESTVIGVIQLREDLNDAQLGMPRDLDGEGPGVDAADHSGDYLILPVVVEVDWLGAAGPAHLEFKTILANY